MKRTFFFVIARRPQLCFKWKTTSIIFVMEDDLDFFMDGRFGVKMNNTVEYICPAGASLAYVEVFSPGRPLYSLQSGTA